MKNVEQMLSELFREWCGQQPVSVTRLAGSGSNRTYYRMHGAGVTLIGAHNEDIAENRAFISFTGQFKEDGLPVPSILASDSNNGIYLLDDLGDTTLYQLLSEIRTREDPFPETIVALYRKVLAWLPVFQKKSGKNIDYSMCYPRAAFDRQSMMWDLNYFKYYFLKLAKIPFDEQALENDFSAFCDLLTDGDHDFFMYRDFQSRNIMIRDGEPWFIDYQGGRRGALQYDVASLLVDAKADMPQEVRRELLQYYLDKLEEVCPVDRERFLNVFNGFVLIRILQALGAYGFRGYYENKSHFLLSIPFALRNLRYLRENELIGFGLETLMGVIDSMIAKPDFYEHPSEKSPLLVTILSFSYKQPLPCDESGHGGGFMFDCRALPNPGRYAEYHELTGKDQPVIGFLEKEPAVGLFLKHAGALVGESVKTYMQRGFEHLQVSFGCTGGQHRSVYCTEMLAKSIRSQFPVTVETRHVELEKWEQNRFL